ncbi:MAG: zf-HC2 domain-containing protein, partial [Solirubrobacteraceae bacterium]
MTDDRDSTPQSRECGDDVAAYALGALAAAEADAFLRHLDACAVCRDELASFEEV